jgi:hypothetical protein
MGYKILTDKHPTMQKVEKVFDLFNTLGISFEVMQNRTIVTDKEFPDIDFLMVDIEDRLDDPTYSIDTIPPNFDYKIGFKAK